MIPLDWFRDNRAWLLACVLCFMFGANFGLRVAADILNDAISEAESERNIATACELTVSLMKLSAESLDWEEVRQRGQLIAELK